MVIVPNRVGQLGNQLFHMAHFAASAMHSGYKFVFASFEYPLEEFPNINSDSRILVRRSSSRVNVFQARMCKALLNLCPFSPFHASLFHHEPPHYDLGDMGFRKIAHEKFVICQGFAFRNPSALINHRDDIVRLLAFSEQTVRDAEEFRSHHEFSSGDIVVGFHVRRADYRWYQGGRYHMSDEAWAQVIGSIRSQVSGSGRRFRGICFSNEDCTSIIGRFQGEVVAGPGGLYSDCQMMSKCDYIVGPPSTYSGWASFVGRVPVVTIGGPHASPLLEDGIPVEW